MHDHHHKRYGVLEQTLNQDADTVASTIRSTSCLRAARLFLSTSTFGTREACQWIKGSEACIALDVHLLALPAADEPIRCDRRQLSSHLGNLIGQNASSGKGLPHCATYGNHHKIFTGAILSC